MPKKHRAPTELPIQFPLDPKKMGGGQDNKVYRIEVNDPEVSSRIGGFVLKIGNPPKNTGEEKQPFTVESAHNDLMFKQNKYRLLKTFLGDLIPGTEFFIGSQRNPDGSTDIRPYSVQHELPQFTLKDLTPEQRNSDKLRGNMYTLMSRMRNMYDALDRARAIVEGQGRDFLVDASLDLGPFSRYVREHPDEDPRVYNYKHMITGYKDSPNLLVDPETLDIACVDFGSGEWNPELSNQLSLVYDIAQHDPEINANLPNLGPIQGTEAS